MIASAPSPDQTAIGRGDGVLVRVSNVAKYYGHFKTLDDVSLDIHRGEVVAIVGTSGSGKSTLCRAVNCLKSIQEGQIEINGIPLPQEGQALAQLRAGVGVVFQSLNLFPHRTVLDNITLTLVKVHGIPRGRAEERARELLARVGLEDQVGKRSSQLSGGQQQRVTTTRTPAMDLRFTLFDESTSALDPEIISKVLDVIKDLTASDMTMLVITHEVGFACLVADRVVFMDSGQTVKSDQPAEFFSFPRVKHTRDFFSKVLNRRAPNRILSRVRRPPQTQRLGRPLPIRTRGAP